MSLDLMQGMFSPTQVNSQSGGGTPYQTAARGNRYIPPTYNYGRNQTGGNTPNYRQMDWNTMQDYYLPNATNRPLSGQIQQGGRGSQAWMNGQYGNPNSQPVMPQFGGGDPYNMYDPRGGREGGQQGGRGNGRMPRFDPRMLAALMRGGMSEGEMFGDSGGDIGMNDYYDYAPRGRGRGRQDYQQDRDVGRYGPKDPMAGIKPNQIKDPTTQDQPKSPSWWDYASAGFGG